MSRLSRRLIATCALALLLALMASTALAVEGTVTASSVVLRKEMSTNSDAVLTLRKGDEVEVISKSGSWYKVKDGGKTGYVMTRYIKVSGTVDDAEETLRQGMRGDNVKKMQQRLKELGYLTGNADGVFGTESRRALEAFQKRNGLKADGVAGEETLKLLYGKSALKAESVDREAKDDETLRPGMTGAKVKELQTRLRALGYFNHSLDSRYDNQVTEAVKAFQKRNGLTADGIAGPATLKKVYSASAKPAAGTESPSDDGKNDDADETLRPGMSGAKVKELQTRLRALGYFNHALDGKYDNQLKEAVVAFQKRNGLSADGIAGPATLKKVFASNAKPAAGTEAPDEGDEDDTTSTLRPGMTGTKVKELQTRLRALGYFNHSLDGKYDNQLKEAVVAFQKRNGLSADGIAGPATLKKVYSGSAKPAEGQQDDPADEETITLNTAVSMKIGDESNNVKAMQQRLKALGYFSGTCTGYYGTATREAVKAFQRNNNLSVDGIAGTATLRKLASSEAKKANGSSAGDDVEVLRPGMTGAAVKTMQTRLRALGYFNHSLDGRYDSQVTEAVKAFQKRNGLTVDGIAGAKTLAKLTSSSAKPALGSSGNTGSTDEDEDEDDTTLRPGMTGTKVKALQTRLRALGYFNHSLDGKYDNQVTEAVKAFQKRNGLSQDGIAGKATLTKLYSSSAKPADNSSADDDDDAETTTLRPGMTGAKVKELQTRLRALGYFDHSLDGKYDAQVTEAVKAFQKRNGLTADGIAGKSTQAKLYSNSAKPAEGSSSGSGDTGNTGSTYKTERLDWFNGGASRIPRGAIFTVKDVRTGKTFRAKRQAGGNHLDAEPLTAADTAILKAINNFSWRRRPMLVLYNGRVYACSIYAEPHGTDTIADNNYDGQFCLHFYGSRTHGTNVVDPDHAKCERDAMNATW